jgi:hypothetical protein
MVRIRSGDGKDLTTKLASGRPGRTPMGENGSAVGRHE